MVARDEHHRPFRFGLSSWPRGMRDEWLATVRRAEDVGFATLVMPDHPVDDQPGLFAALTAAAMTTERLRVGPFVIDNDWRHPALAARELAMIDWLSNGRLEVGLGAGHMEWEYDQLGVPFDRATTRLERLQESIAIVRALLDAGEATHHGKHYQLESHKLGLRPAQAHVPILLGGNGDRLLRLAARHADIVGFTGFTPADGGRRPDASHFSPEGLDDRVALVRAAAGERFASLELNLLVQFVALTEDRRAAAEAVAALAPGLEVDDVLASPFALLGTSDEMEAELLARRERFGISYVVVFDRFLDDVSEVVSRLAGH